MNKHKLEISTAEAAQLLAYLNERDTGADEGWYYGKKRDFENRHVALRAKLQACLLSTAGAKQP